MDLQPCPFCKEVPTGYEQRWVNEVPCIQRVCGCSARGPVAQTFTEADDKWNIRSSHE